MRHDRIVGLLAVPLLLSACFHNTTSTSSSTDQGVDTGTIDVGADADLPTDSTTVDDALDSGVDSTIDADLSVDGADLSIVDADLSIDDADLGGDADLSVDVGVDQLVCPYGTRPDGTCLQLRPANGLSFDATPLVFTVAQGSTVQIDTTNCTASNGHAGDSTDPTWCVYRVQQLIIEADATLSATGNRFLAILASDSVSIAGHIDVGAHGEIAGPGGGAAGPSKNEPGQGDGGGQVCNCNDWRYDDCGGGGGGHATVGGAGGDDQWTCSTPSAGGAQYGAAELEPMSAGSGGAAGGQAEFNEIAGRGGAGGGALQISSGGSFEIDGTINAGGGGGGADANFNNEVSGGGGGSGGGVLLEAEVITGQGTVAANGGGGGGARPSNCSQSVDNGADGAPTLSAAVGGLSSCFGDFDGGDGGANTAPQQGASGNAPGAGGGGAAGRIRLNTYDHLVNVPALQTSPLTTFGEIAVE